MVFVVLLKLGVGGATGGFFSASLLCFSSSAILASILRTSSSTLNSSSTFVASGFFGVTVALAAWVLDTEEVGCDFGDDTVGFGTFGFTVEANGFGFGVPAPCVFGSPIFPNGPGRLPAKPPGREPPALPPR